MKTTSKVLSVASIGFALTASLAANAQTLVGDYEFNNTLSSSVSGAPDLIATDPLGQNNFGTATVLGSTHSVYNFVGNTTPSQQAGLTLDTSSLITPNNYSVQLVASLDNVDTWRRLIDTQNRASDNGFYYNPSHQLEVFPIAGGGTQVLANTFEDVVLTVTAGVGGNPSTVKGYLNDDLEFTATTDVMNLNFDTTDNPGALMNFFLDNLVGGGQGEYSSGSVAEIKVYDGVLSDQQVADLDANPLSPAPEATSTVFLLSLATGVLLGFNRKQK
ncbi:MAG TPA: PEP-CTERM sorting domain-containing protein [Verrucomicrobiae bacterium]|jgi:hypothetical protein|nr:PEP-CTERM sorting domain-containing protein [Verrucomicrobiae bacterium]